MSVFKGNTASTATSEANNIPSDIISFSIANKTGGTITASVGVLYGSTATYFLYTKPLAAAGALESEYIYTGKPIRIEANHQIFVSVSGSTDFYFTIL